MPRVEQREERLCCRGVSNRRRGRGTYIAAVISICSEKRHHHRVRDKVVRVGMMRRARRRRRRRQRGRNLRFCLCCRSRRRDSCSARDLRHGPRPSAPDLFTLAARRGTLRGSRGGLEEQGRVLGPRDRRLGGGRGREREQGAAEEVVTIRGGW